MKFVDSGSTMLVRVCRGATLACAAFVAGCASPGGAESFFALNDGAVVIASTSSVAGGGQPTLVGQIDLNDVRTFLLQDCKGLVHDTRNVRVEIVDIE